MTFPAHGFSTTWMRRAMRTGGLALAALLLSLSSVHVAAAAPGYTSATTRFAIGQQTFTATITLDARAARMIRGPVAIVVKLPPGVQGRVASADRGFNRRGYDISFQEDSTLSTKALFLITVPSRTAAPLTVDIGASGGYALGAPGNTNQAVALAITI